MTHRSWGRLLVALLAVVTLVTVLGAGGAQAQQGVTTDVHGRAAFVANMGQWDQAANFRMSSGGANVWATQRGPVYEFIDPSALGDRAVEAGEIPPPEENAERDVQLPGHVVAVRFAGGFAAGIEGANLKPGLTNFLVGPEEDWVTGVRKYGSVIFRDVYPGIDYVISSLDDAEVASEFDSVIAKTTFVVHPGARASDIELIFDGADSVTLEAMGGLAIETSVGTLRELAPTAMQVGDGSGEPVQAQWVLENGRARFALGANYDSARTLYIDPVVLFSRRIGGTGTDYLDSLNRDAAGNLYMSGWSSSSNFPTTVGAFQTTFAGGSYDCFVVKTNGATGAEIYSTYVGSTSTEYNCQSILAPNGEVVLAASYTGSGTWPGAPVQITPGGSTDVAIARLNATGTALTASAEVGGTSTDYVHDIQLMPNGNYALTGTTFSSSGWPSLGGAQPSMSSSPDTYAVILNSTLNGAVGFSYAGGTSSDYGNSLAVDPANNVYIMWTTLATDLPLIAGPGGNYDVGVAKFNPTLTTFTYEARFGGASTEPTTGGSDTSYSFYQSAYNGIVATAAGELWVTGMTASTDFPVTPGTFRTSNAGNYDVFVSLVNAGGTGLVRSTLIGGSSTDAGRGIKVDPASGYIHVAGSSASTNFPVRNAEDPTNNGSYDYVRVVFLPDLTDIVCSTYLGGTSTDYGQDIAVVSRHRDIVAGSTLSTTSWPAIPTGNVYGPGGGYDVGLADLNCGGAVLAVENPLFTPIPRTHDLDCLTAGDELQYTFQLSNTGLDDQPDNAGPEFEGMLTGPQTGLSCTVSSGTCVVNGTQVTWNGAIPAGGVVDFDIRSRISGGTPAFVEVCLVGTVNFDIGTGQNTQSMEFELCTETNCPPTVNPNAQLGMQVHLPILTFKGADPCDVWLEVQNVGPVPVKAVLITWGEMGFCPPQAAGPLKVECTGLLKPGATWNLLGDQIPDGSKSGMLFKFSTKQLSDFGLDEVFGFDDIFADLMCETLFFGVVGDADDFRRFKKAYNEGGTFAGIPQDIAQGLDDGGILAVDVLRTCDADVTAGAKVTSKYNGIAGNHLGEYDPVYGGYSYYVPLIYAKRTAGTGEYNTWVYIQNGGLECSSVEIWLKRQDDCLRAQICEVTALAPGETYQFDPSTCVGPNWLGSLWIRTTQPMGIAVDIWGNDILMTYIGEPAELNYTFDPTNALATAGNEVAFGPLIYSEYQGWDTGVQVQNLSPVVAAKVKLYFLDRSGDVITTLVDWICPRGSQSFFLPVVHDMPGNWVGSVRVESQEWITPGGPAVRAPNIVAVATLIKYTDAQRSATREAIAYNLLPEHKVYDWQLGFGGGGLDSGVGLIAIPSLLSDLDGTGVVSELAIANVVPKPGFTDFVIYIYDQNGLLDYVCQKLNEKQVEYIDLTTWGFINAGFKGSAIISAYFWEHDVFDGTGFFLRNVVGLGAVAVERSKTTLGQDIPGDEAAGDRGIPFRRSDIEDEEFDFGFMGEIPACPGIPVDRPEPGEEPAFRCPPGVINGTFGQGSPDWDDFDTWTASTRIFRDGVPSECQPQKTCPTTLGGGGFVDAYYFDNPNGTETCVEVNVTHTCGVNGMAYAVSGRMPNGIGWPGCPPAPGVEYLGDVGQSGSPGRMGFTIPEGVTEWTLIIANVSGQTACTYQMTISGFGCQ